MSTPAEQIRTNGEVINRLHARIHETLANRGRSAADREVWAKACEEFHRSFPSLIFPGGVDRWAAFLARDSAEMESAVAFLEVDPKFFRSGYLKQIIWNRLKRSSLTPQHERRLEQVAMAYLQRRVHREFWHMARYMRFRGSQSFWQSMETLASTHTEGPSAKAHWLLLARKNAPVQRWVGKEFLKAKYEVGYSPSDLAPAIPDTAYAQCSAG